MYKKAESIKTLTLGFINRHCKARKRINMGYWDKENIIPIDDGKRAEVDEKPVCDD